MKLLGFEKALYSTFADPEEKDLTFYFQLTDGRVRVRIDSTKEDDHVAEFGFELTELLETGPTKEFVIKGLGAHAYTIDPYVTHQWIRSLAARRLKEGAIDQEHYDQTLEDIGEKPFCYAESSWGHQRILAQYATWAIQNLNDEFLDTELLEHLDQVAPHSKLLGKTLPAVVAFGQWIVTLPVLDWLQEPSPKPPRWVTEAE